MSYDFDIELRDGAQKVVLKIYSLAWTDNVVSIPGRICAIKWNWKYEASKRQNHVREYCEIM